MDSDGSNKRQIGNPLMLDAEVRVSPDGSEIVFDRYDPATGVQAFTIRDLASGEERRVTLTSTGDITHPDWSRDGRSIINNTNQDGSAGIGQQIEVKEGRKNSEGNVATLEISPGQAEIVAQASMRGELALALRSVADIGTGQSGAPQRNQDRGNAIKVLRYGVKSKAYGVN